MNAILWTTLAAMTLLASIALHEAGHAYALHTLGIRLDSAGIGLPVGPMIEFKPTRRRPFTFTISLLLLGAYISHSHGDNERVEGLGWRDTAWVAGAGPAVSFALFGAFLAAYAAARGSLVGFAIGAGVFAAIVLFRRPFCIYVLPLLSIAAVALIVHQLVTIPITVGQGPIEVFRLLASATWVDYLFIISAINLGLGVFNALPVFPLDGHHVVANILQRRSGAQAAKIFRRASGATWAALMVYLLTTDVVSWLVRP